MTMPESGFSLLNPRIIKKMPVGNLQLQANIKLFVFIMLYFEISFVSNDVMNVFIKEYKLDGKTFYSKSCLKF